MTPPPQRDDADAEDVDSGILLWGGPKSGKSTYVASLVFHHEVEGEPWDADWYVMPEDLEAAQFVGDVVLAYRDGQPPPKTDLVRPLRFRITEVHRPKRILGFRTSAKVGREAGFSFVDPRGETFTRDGISGDQGDVVLDFLARASGLLLLVDPTNQQQRAYLRMFVINLVRMFEHLRSLRGAAARKVSGNKLNIPVAICATKMDRFPPGQDPEPLLLRAVGEEAFATLTMALSDFQIFGLSALGLNVVDDGGVMRPRDGLAQPWGVLNPLKWLIDKRGGRG